MKSVLIALFLAGVVCSSLAQDCSSKFKDFHKCLEAGHKKAEADEKAKFAALKPQLDACYTSNGCTPPTKGQKGAGRNATAHRRGNNTAEIQCRKALEQALKGKFEACIKQAIPTFTFPPKGGKGNASRGGEERGREHKREDEGLEGCANKQAVIACKRALLNSTRPTDAQKRAQFTANCATKQTCLTALGADCQAQMEKFKTASCQCRQQERQQEAQTRPTITACNGVQENKGNHTRGPQKQETCGAEKDYCKLGYDAFVAGHPKGKDQ